MGTEHVCIKGNQIPHKGTHWLANKQVARGRRELTGACLPFCQVGLGTATWLRAIGVGSAKESEQRKGKWIRNVRKVTNQGPRSRPITLLIAE